MHPNWRALASLHIPHKIFVSASQSATEILTESSTSTTIKCDLDSRKEYESILESSPSQNNQGILKARTRSDSKRKTAISTQSIPFDKNVLFKAAIRNDADMITKMFSGNNQINPDINTVDNFGWTALMMASCEGAFYSVSALIEFGADQSLTDKKGHCALSLAQSKNHTSIVHELLKSRQMGKHATRKEEPAKRNNEQIKYKPFFCKLCKLHFKETSKRNHNASTIHQFNDYHKSKFKCPTRYGLPDSHRGFQMLVKQGWDREKGLGPHKSGQQFPIKTVLRKRNTGLGIKQDPPKVTHFGMYDVNAIKYIPVEKPITKKEIHMKVSKDKRKEILIRRELS
jgi:G-patch domain/Ankyrin repeats (3 copies)